MAVADRMLKPGVRNLRHWAVNLRRWIVGIHCCAVNLRRWIVGVHCCAVNLCRWIVGVHCCAVKSCLVVAVKPLKIRLLAQLTGIKKQPVSYAN